MKQHRLPAFVVAASVFLSGCSAGSAFTKDGGLGALIGGALGAGAGAALGDQRGEAEAGAVLGGVVGAGLGLIAGAVIHEQGEEAARKNEIIVRRAAPVSLEQREIDALREEVYDSTSWGRGEVKPWNERYRGDNPNIPYQGPASSTFRN